MPRRKAGQLEELVRLLAFLGAAVGEFRRPDRIFAKIGVETINSDLATLLRTAVIAIVLAAMSGLPGNISRSPRFRRALMLF